MKQIVMIESPFSGDIERNAKYARAAIMDSLNRGEAPFASHILYPQQGLQEPNKEERQRGMEAGFTFRGIASKTVVYQDLGISQGMRLGIEHSIKIGIPVEYRSLPQWKEKIFINPDE